MDTFGKKLRLAIEMQGLRLEDVARATGLEVEWLEALARDDHQALPDDGSVTEGLQAFAQLLDVNPDEVIEDYLREREGRRPSRAAAPSGGLEPGATGRAPDRPMSAAQPAFVAGTATPVNDAQPACTPEPVPPMTDELPDLVPDTPAPAREAPVFKPDTTRQPPVPRERGLALRLIFGTITLAALLAGFVWLGSYVRRAPAGAPSPSPVAAPDGVQQPQLQSPAATFSNDAPLAAVPPPAAAPSPRQTADTTTRQAAQPAADPAVASTGSAPSRPEPTTAPGGATQAAAASPGIAIPQYGVGTGVVNRQLVGEADRFAEGSRVWFWTWVEGAAAGQTIEHVWLHEGQVKNVVPLQLGGPRWRTQSYKNLHPGSTGAWVVEARDAAGRVLARSAFDCH